MSLEPFIGEIKIFGFNFAPRGYMTCQGQIISIQQNTALFSLLGTYYGGNGQSTFGLPDLQGRMPIGQGTGAGLPTYNLGEKAGTTSVTIATSNMPAHNHVATGITVNLPVSTGGGDVASPEGAYLANTGAEVLSSVSTPGKNYGALAVSGTTGIAGSSTPLGIINPYLVINYSIATEGIFPSRP
jgi:microcystin-dependent protein